MTGFHKYMFENVKPRKVSNETTELQERERKRLRASETSFDAHKLYSTYLNDKGCAIIFPNCLKPLHHMLIFSLSTACVERFYSKMNLVKTRLRNQLSQVKLENLLLIATEAPKTRFTDSEYNFCC